MSGGNLAILDASAVARCVKRLAHEIVERNPQTGDLALVGILRRGATVALRLKAALGEITAADIPIATLDISLYRDDNRSGAGDPRLLAREVPFSLDGKRVVLVD